MNCLEQQAFTCVHVRRSSFLFKHRIFPKPDSTFGSDALAVETMRADAPNGLGECVGFCRCSTHSLRAPQLFERRRLDEPIIA